MAHLLIRSEVPHPFEWVRANFDKRLFEALAPAFPQMRLDRYDGQRPGDLISLRLGISPIWARWTSQITEVVDTPDKYEFIDVGIALPPPLSLWQHTHTLSPNGPKLTLIEDRIKFEVSPKWALPLILPLMRAQFGGRRAGYSRYYDGLKNQSMPT